MLYFLKKHGNEATHSITVKQDGMEALECLQRAFEIAISYSVYNKGAKDFDIANHTKTNDGEAVLSNRIYPRESSQDIVFVPEGTLKMNQVAFYPYESGLK